MASELRVDTLKDSSGSNSVGMAYVAGGSAKAWFTFNYTAIQDSLNISSVTDEATGHCFGNFSSSMTNDDFAHPFKTGAYRDRYEETGPDATTSRTNTLETYNSSGSSADDNIINCTVHGDLA